MRFDQRSGAVVGLLLAMVLAVACGSGDADEGPAATDDQVERSDDAGTSPDDGSARDADDGSAQDADGDGAGEEAEIEPGGPTELPVLATYTAHLIDDNAGVDAIFGLADGRIGIFANGSYELEACSSAPPGQEPNCFSYMYDSALRIVDPNTLEDVAVLPAVLPDANPIELDDGRLLLTSDLSSSNLNIWDPAKDYGPPTVDLPAGSAVPPPPPPQQSYDVLAMLVPTGYISNIADKAPLADGRIALAGLANGVQVWDLADLEHPVATYVTLPADFDHAQWMERFGDAFPGSVGTEDAQQVIELADGRIVAGYRSGVVRLWDPSGLGDPTYTDANGVPTWDVADDGLLDVVHTFDDSIQDLVELGDGRIALATPGGTFAFDPADSSPTEICVGPAGQMTTIVPLSNDRLAIATGETISICDIGDPGSPIVAVFSERLGAPSAGLVELDDGRVASASQRVGDSVHVWDPTTID